MLDHTWYLSIYMRISYLSLSDIKINKTPKHYIILKIKLLLNKDDTFSLNLTRYEILAWHVHFAISINCALIRREKGRIKHLGLIRWQLKIDTIL